MAAEPRTADLDARIAAQQAAARRAKYRIVSARQYAAWLSTVTTSSTSSGNYTIFSSSCAAHPQLMTQG